MLSLEKDRIKDLEENKISFAKQATILAAASLFVRFIGFIYRIPLTSLIGDIGNGIYSTGFYIYNFFLVVSSAGLPAAISKMVSERVALKQYKNAHKVFKVSLIITSVLGTIFGLIMWFGAEKLSNLFKMPQSYYTILTLAPTVLIVAIMSSYRGYFQGLKTTVPTAISQIIEQIFNAIFSIVLAYILFSNGLKILDLVAKTKTLTFFEKDFEFIVPILENKSVEFGAAGGTAGTGVGALCGLIFLIFAYILIKPSLSKKINKNFDNSPEENGFKIAKNLLKISLVIVTGTAIMSVTNLIDMQMVMSRLLDAGFTHKDATTYYGQLTGKYSTLTTLPVALSTAFATATIPNIASAVVLKDKTSIKRKINIALRLTMIISIPAAIGLGVLSDPILKLLFPKYPAGGHLLRIGAVSVIFLSLAQIITGILQGINKAIFPIIAISIGAVVKIVLNYFLIVIPSINVSGSVISTTACYIIAAILDLWALRRYTHIDLDILSIFAKPLVSGVVMGLACFFSYKLFILIIPFNSIVTIISIVVSIFVYTLSLLLLKGLSKSDILIFPFGSKIANLLEKFNLL